MFYLTWVNDVFQTHLSDDYGMPILVQLLWQACYMQLELDDAATVAPVSPPPPCPTTRRVSPRVEVPEPLPVTPPPPPEWIKVRQGSKVRYCSCFVKALFTEVALY